MARDRASASYAPMTESDSGMNSSRGKRSVENPLLTFLCPAWRGLSRSHEASWVLPLALKSARSVLTAHQPYRAYLRVGLVTSHGTGSNKGAHPFGW